MNEGLEWVCTHCSVVHFLPLEVVGNVEYVNCDYCGVEHTIQRDEGLDILTPVEKLWSLN